MDAGLKNSEDTMMKCHVCGERMAPTNSDLPFRLGPTTIVVLKQLPVLECVNCSEVSIEDPVMRKIDNLLEQTDDSTELAVIPYAAVV